MLRYQPVCYFIIFLNNGNFGNYEELKSKFGTQML